MSVAILGFLVVIMAELGLIYTKLPNKQSH
jgi:hypothetical protein